VAELTYRCPLHCVYCSNPTNYADHTDRLSAADWVRVMREAESQGVLQVLLSGGEPLLRKDLEAIVQGAADGNLYTNLITSGIPLDRNRLARLHSLGLNAVQVSIQDTTAANSDRISGTRSFERKLEVASWVKDLGMPLTLNVVIHKGNIDRVVDIISMAEKLGADRLELANAQYLAWALLNRSQLLPTKDQLSAARKCAQLAKERLLGKMEVLFVLPDYYSDRPKACMSGWGRRYLVISPDGFALPCHLAHTITGMQFDNVLDRSIEDIWHNAESFQAFRGESWMSEPCRSCDLRAVDFGGCRCQAFHLAGDAKATDPACSLSPTHDLILTARGAAHHQFVPADLVYRTVVR
jgi:pyrroloquinoline quinone biosynthesis protein E